MKTYFRQRKRALGLELKIRVFTDPFQIDYARGREVYG